MERDLGTQKYAKVKTVRKKKCWRHERSVYTPSDTNKRPRRGRAGSGKKWWCHNKFSLNSSTIIMYPFLCVCCRHSGGNRCCRRRLFSLIDQKNFCSFSFASCMYTSFIVDNSHIISLSLRQLRHEPRFYFSGENETVPMAEDSSDAYTTKSRWNENKKKKKQKNLWIAKHLNYLLSEVGSFH